MHAAREEIIFSIRRGTDTLCISEATRGTVCKEGSMREGPGWSTQLIGTGMEPVQSLWPCKGPCANFAVQPVYGAAWPEGRARKELCCSTHLIHDVFWRWQYSVSLYCLIANRINGAILCEMGSAEIVFLLLRRPYWDILYLSHASLITMVVLNVSRVLLYR